MKLCLVGWESNPSTEIAIKAKCRFYLGSYLYLRDTEAIEKVKPVKEFLIIDSGAFTLQRKHKGKIDYDQFVYEYAQWLKRHPEVDEYVELDIDNVAELKDIERWRDYLTKELGKAPIVVWHEQRGKQYWYYMVKKYDYVGISFASPGTSKRAIPDEYVGWFVKTAHDHDAKIHGFALTSPKITKVYPFDSIDSTSWTMSVRTGNIYVLKNGVPKMKTGYSKHYGCKYDYYARLYNSAKVWVQYQNFLYDFWKAKKEKSRVVAETYPKKTKQGG